MYPLKIIIQIYNI